MLGSEALETVKVFSLASPETFEAKASLPKSTVLSVAGAPSRDRGLEALH